MICRVTSVSRRVTEKPLKASSWSKGRLHKRSVFPRDKKENTGIFVFSRVCPLSVWAKQTNKHGLSSLKERFQDYVSTSIKLPRKIRVLAFLRAPPSIMPPHLVQRSVSRKKHAISLFCSWTLELRAGIDDLSFELHTVPLLIHNLNAHYLLINVCEKNQQKFLQLS